MGLSPILPCICRGGGPRVTRWRGPSDSRNPLHHPSGGPPPLEIEGRNRVPPEHRHARLVTNTKEGSMSDHVYKIVEIVGSSAESIEKAIEAALARASASLHG